MFIAPICLGSDRLRRRGDLSSTQYSDLEDYDVLHESDTVSRSVVSLGRGICEDTIFIYGNTGSKCTIPSFSTVPNIVRST